MNTLGRFSPNIGQMSRDEMMLKRFHRNPCHRGSVRHGESSGASMSFAAGSHARTSVTQGNEVALELREADCFSKPFGWLHFFDHDAQVSIKER